MEILKLQSFFILKLRTRRLKEEKYKINLTLSQARENNEVVRIGDSNVLEFLRRIKKQDDYKEELYNAELAIRKLRKGRNTDGNRKKLESLQYVVDKHLFVPEIVSVVFDDNRHYKHIINNGLFINDVKYVRLYSGAGSARRSTAFFIDERYYEKMDWYIDCGRKQDIKLNNNKYNAYFALASSGGLPVKTPKFVVIPDLEVTRPTMVDMVTESTGYGIDPKVEEMEIQQTFNLFDGEGLMSPSYANQLAYDLELDYTPASAIIRGAWIKGLLVTFDFQEYARRNKSQTIVDIYGDTHNIKDIDCILTASQFKMSAGYDNLQQYKEEVEKRNFQWRVTRPSPKKDKNQVQSNYQYLQVLNLNDEDIQELCKDTINYFRDLSGLSWSSIMLFLIGSLKKEDITQQWFDRLDPLIKVLFYEPEMISDKFVLDKIKRMISKKIRESYIGVLNMFGNYQTMISDPFALVQHAFGHEIAGLLSSREFYSNYWNNLNVNKVASLRSPLTHHSEVNILDLKNNKDLKYWYKYLNTGIVYNVFDNSVMLHSGSDEHPSKSACMVTYIE